MKRWIKKVFRNSFFEPILFLPFFKFLVSPNKEYAQPSFRFAKRNGIRYQLDLSEYMEHAIYFGHSIEERATATKYLRSGMYVFDIGANVGDTTLEFAKRVGKTGKVFSFEPVDNTYAKLQKNISLNDFGNILTYNVALSDREEELEFGYSWNNNSSGIQMHKRPDEATDSSQKNLAMALTLDGFVRKHKIDKVDFIKIDVEGFENYVLNGAIATIQLHKPFVYIEVSDDNLKLQNSSAHALLNLLSALGYTLFDARTNKLITLGVDFSGVHLDALCIHHSKK